MSFDSHLQNKLQTDVVGYLLKLHYADKSNTAIIKIGFIQTQSQTQKPKRNAFNKHKVKLL